MKISGNDPIARLKKLLDRHSVGQASQIPAGSVASPGDRLEVARTAREFHAIREAALREPAVRTELVTTFRARIEAGAYEPNVRIIAQRVLASLREGSDA